MRPTYVIVFVFFWMFLAGQTNAQTWQDDVGFTDLQNLVGGTLEDGATQNVAQVEAILTNNSTTAFLPGRGNSEFSGVNFNDGTVGGTFSGHANTVATLFYGNAGSIAQGISNVTNFEAGDYLNRVILNNGGDPQSQSFDVGNHSYIVPNLDDSVAVDVLERFDFAINRDNSVQVVGINNGAGSSIPELLAPSYNSVVVGRTDGNHSRGTTTVYGEGRSVPTIVAPGINPANGFVANSFAIPKVSSAVALLREQSLGTNAIQNEVTRALLYAGATKDEFATYNRTSTQPIDEVFGFGELNILNSYLINEGGEFDGLTNVNSTNQSVIGPRGWDYGQFDGANDIFYNFTIEDGDLVTDLSAALTWNIDITDLDASADVFDAVSQLANLDLTLYDSTESFLGVVVDESVSDVLNNEHIFLDGISPLTAGDYTFVISGDLATDFGFAFSFSTTAIPEPTACIHLACLIVMTTLRRRSTKL